MQVKCITFLCHLVFLCFLITQLSGCGVILVGGAAAGTVAYVSGDLTATLDADLERSVAAVDGAIQENTIQQVSRTVDGLGATYVLLTHQDDRVEITLTETIGGITSIAIRVGFFGDESLSHKILDEIQARIH